MQFTTTSQKTCALEANTTGMNTVKNQQSSLLIFKKREA